ncbi:hypothetical protein O0I10_004996 [Lichtheimia ornata]|uniref:Uncharacterized protein n=1 Tax=Lichtheimia ornata TaxID=688661 RepID=A0AAD7V7C0_9FUNG|nr:uncharacterized protein O0I10_004996 [Lichtheimia ornata]KAJ8659282.1 hypothetical protein O0I10_004996 [Lichtheimia ornata]
MLRPQGFKNASSVRTLHRLRLLISLPLEKMVSLLMHFIASIHWTVPSAGDDCVIQRDHCKELLVFWCFGFTRSTAMIAKYYSMGLDNCLWCIFYR